ncbi:helix-turn-helix transcriptional regulator, partial [Streptomyces sp. CJ_13]|uniref:helix-turn-helix domain-containing protein n=1 Tax=Streptomyces sp. CJ_13 TaxID=2724943 RepID=UPI00202A5637
MIYSAEALNKGASAYLAAAHTTPSSPALLAELGKFWVLVQDAEAALVHRGRLQGESWDNLANSTHVSKERLRKRWKALSLHHRVQKIQAQAARAAEARAAEPLPAVKHPVPSQTPGQQLAGALSFLQRKTGQTLAGTAALMEISPSYLSRIVNGQRNPTWPIVQRFASVCGGHLAELRDLWEAARRPPDPHFPSRL